MAFITSGTGSGASWKLASVKLYDNQNLYLYVLKKKFSNSCLKKNLNLNLALLLIDGLILKQK